MGKEEGGDLAVRVVIFCRPYIAWQFLFMCASGDAESIRGGVSR